MREPIDFDQLDRYLSGSASAEERGRVEQAAARNPELRQLLDALSSAVRQDPGGWNTEQAIADFSKKRQRRPAHWLPLAAAALLIIAIGVGVLQRSAPKADRLPQTAAAPQEYRSARGQHLSISLEDGSSVILSAGSLLRVPIDYASNRKVQLEGEAFFDVKSDSARPFLVNSGPAQTRVLGTSFNVSAHPNGAVEVAVVTGRVELRPSQGNAARAAVLTPGQAGRLEGDAEIAVRTVDVNDYIAWQQGRLVFRDVSLEEVSTTLERWYDVDFQINDPTLARSHVTAFFEKQTVTEVVDVLAETLGARYERTGNSITFYRK